MKALEVRNLKKSYGDIQAVRGISFDVDQGEIFALVGPNGAGKSTVLKIIATILSPSDGDVFVYGEDLRKDPVKIRDIITYLPEDAGAYKNLSGIQYLKFMAAIYSDNTAEQKTFFEFATQMSGLEDRLKDKVKTYSKGMIRKLLLARTFMARPKLTILDEPTSGLDVINGFEIRKMVKDLAQEGMAVLLSSHNMLEIEFMSDHVALIDKGIIKAVGEPQQLMDQNQAKNLEEVFVKVTS